MTSPGFGEAGASRIPSRVGLTGVFQLSSNLLPQHSRGRASLPFLREGKLRPELTGPRSHSPGRTNNRLCPATEASCAHAQVQVPPSLPNPGSSAGRTGASPTRPARPLRSGECGLARRTLGRVPEPAAGERGHTGRRQGDPRLRSPRTARLLRVPPLPNFPPRSSPAADLPVQRALGALPGCQPS